MVSLAPFHSERIPLEEKAALSIAQAVARRHAKTSFESVAAIQNLALACSEPATTCRRGHRLPRCQNLATIVGSERNALAVAQRGPSQFRDSAPPMSEYSVQCVPMIQVEPQLLETPSSDSEENYVSPRDP